MDHEESRNAQGAAGGTANSDQRARLKRDLDDFVDFMEHRVLEDADPAAAASREPDLGSNDN